MQDEPLAETSASLVPTTPPASVATADCPNCGQLMRATGSAGFAHVSAPFVYAVGRLTPQFPALHVEKEFAHLAADVEGPEISEQRRLKDVLGRSENMYLARHVCWVFTTQQIDTFIVVPRDRDDIRELTDAFAPGAADVIHVCVGGPATTPVSSACASSGLPLIAVDQLLSFTLDEFLDALSAESDGDGETHEQRDAMRELFVRITQRTDNHGIAAEHRALNYLALRYPAIYHTTAQAVADGKTLIGIDARPAPGAERRVVSVTLTFRSRRTQIVESFACLVDVTDEFPFLVRGLAPTYT